MSSDRSGRDPRVGVAYLAPWVDLGGTAKGTLDWFRTIDRDRFAPSLLLTQAPSRNRLLPEVAPYAEEVWNLPDLMPGGEMPYFILDFVHSRGIEVVHVMNSRLAFDLLPDLSLLPRPPAIVVQLHVEEETRAGYVRYVTTRYGNLVDAFSVTSRHLADTMIDEYDVAPAKCRVIYTGVDAEGEFRPGAVAPAGERDDGRVHLLFLGRLVKQKDPHLMLDVVEALRRVEEGFVVDVVGYGEMEQEVRDAAAARGLGGHVSFHGPTERPAGWYAAADVVLLTSRYEGIPYVQFEALSMGVPVVAPRLPGTAEIMDERHGRLIDPRDDVRAYVEALAPLVRDRALREELGAAGREHMRSHYSLEAMGAAHDALYDELLARRGGRAQRPGMVVS